MLRGNYTARIDDKGRLKVPTEFRRLIEEKHGKDFYITSVDGQCVRIYPLPEWESIEQRLSLLPSMDPTKRRFLDRTNYYGQQATIDGQGRLLIHPLLRKSAEVLGDVAVDHPSPGVRDLEQDVGDESRRHEHGVLPHQIVLGHAVHGQHEDNLVWM